MMCLHVWVQHAEKCRRATKSGKMAIFKMAHKFGPEVQDYYTDDECAKMLSEDTIEILIEDGEGEFLLKDIEFLPI